MQGGVFWGTLWRIRHQRKRATATQKAQNSSLTHCEPVQILYFTTFDWCFFQPALSLAIANFWHQQQFRSAACRIGQPAAAASGLVFSYQQSIAAQRLLRSCTSTKCTCTRKCRCSGMRHASAPQTACPAQGGGSSSEAPHKPLTSSSRRGRAPRKPRSRQASVRVPARGCRHTAHAALRYCVAAPRRFLSCV